MSSNENEPTPPKPRLVHRILGELHWTPPAWAVALGRALLLGVRGAWGAVRRHPKRFALGLIVLMVVAVGVDAAYRWYESRPKPVRYDVSATSPNPTPIEEPPRWDSVHVRFSGSVAPLEAIGKPVATGITLKPAIAGAWRWADDRTLTFIPAEDWAVGQEYSVTLERSLFPDHVLLAAYETTFRSAPFRAFIHEFSFYEDPRNPKEKRVVATVRFSHPVDPTSLMRNLSLKLKGKGGGLLGPKDGAYAFNVTYDKLKGEAYLQSDLIPIPDDDGTMVLTVAKGVRAARGGEGIQEELSRQVTIPGMFNYFRVEGVDVSLVRNERYEPEQVLVVNLTTGVTEAELRKNLEVRVLPRDRAATADEAAVPNFSWDDTSRIGDAVVAASEKLALEPISTDREHATLHSFRIRADVGRYLYFRLAQGTRSAGGYVLAKRHDVTLRVPRFPEEVSILHEGALLSLAGEKKVTVLSRDVQALRFQLGRVLPEQVNHLVSQTSGSFAHPSFENYRFDEQNISESFTEVRSLEGAGRGKAQYAAFDLTDYLTPANSPSARRGLFFFKVQSWDPAHKRSTGPEDSRLLLVTDLGLVVKDNADGSHDLFVQTLGSGAPAEGVTVSVLGKNGLPVLSATTDADGHVAFPRMTDFVREQESTVYLARKGEDFAFIPVSRSDRQLNFSRFDVGGMTSGSTPERLTAFLFSDRGLYRPGDTFHVAMVVKASDWSQPPSGVPLEASIMDPRGLEVHKQKLSLSATGLEALQFTTQETSPTGSYAVNLYVVKDGLRGSLLGSTQVRVEEFLPDRMRITTRFSAERAEGWVSPEKLKGQVKLTNLFGIAAAGRRVSAELTLSPMYPGFRQYPGYTFHDPFSATRTLTERLEDTKTNDEGEAELELGLEKFEKATWRVSLLAEGYEAEGGRGVSSGASILVSPLAYLVGFKPDGGLGYLSQGSERSVDFIAVDPALKRLAVKGLKAELVERRWVSVLTRQPNGTYRYQSARRDTVLRTRELAIPEAGFRYALSTEQPGDFVVVVKDAEGTQLSRVEYTVAGRANLTRALEKNAELEVKLSRQDYAPGDDIELSIKAPYTGAGLITIERDRVYAWKWFKTDATSTVQSIRLPPGLEGNGYVNVTFVRAMDSQEIFMSPLSYGVVPFSVSKDSRILQVTLTSAERARPGEPYRIRYKGSGVGRAVVFAVDEGILQVAGYSTPDPLSHFFKKRALEVRTGQILDLLLPEFSVSKAVSAMGGDAEGMDAIGKNLNPFKRKRDKPVAYWSGVVDIDTSERELVYAVPDSFNGELRVMAVAVGRESVGAATKRATIRGPFVITPSVPTFVAPGDEFSVGVAVANAVDGSGKGAQVTLELKTSEHLEVLGESRRPLKIDEGREASTTFRLRAKAVLGSGSLSFSTSLGNERARQTVDLSVRPAVPYLTSVTGGHVTDNQVDVPVSRRMYGDYRLLEVSASSVPLGLARGLATYLEQYPHGCTEQLVSRAFPHVVLKDRKELLGKAALAPDASFAEALRMLRGRQNDEGAFGLWAANAYAPVWPSIYALHFLTEAKERGFAVPPDLLNRGLTWLSGLVDRQPQTLTQARAVAYGQYVLTRNGKVSGASVNSLRTWLDENAAQTWRKDLTAAYLAATYRLLKQEKEAGQALAQVRVGEAQQEDYAALYDRLVYDAQVLYLLSRHFPERLEQLSGDALVKLAAPIHEGSFNTLSSAYAILGFDAYARALKAKAEPGAVSVQEKVAEALRPLTVPQGLFAHVGFSDAATALRVKSESSSPLFFQVTQAGYDLEPPKVPVIQRLEVQRELRDLEGRVVKEVPLGGEVEVHLMVRQLEGASSAVAIIDLLPGGFEVVMERPTPSEQESSDESHASEEEPRDEEGDGYSEESAAEDDSYPEPVPVPGSWLAPAGSDRSTFQPEYVDVREDRVVLYGTASATVTEFVYRIKATNAGQYVMPPAFAEGMYDRRIRARSVGTTVVVNAP
ncbi:alpha-2-macroglobulin family protein [Myxococcus stipitatus]|uniref:alpha-2-macroglobulin family protein n=1 Tax=Myxococcus stipitatus TaxID=83455 RepID=UPI001F4825A6|nr:alpha-2-macroglobulin [Myxococcus stipitatus]MCE9672039.1 alpha-2-macroglobulin family protein [Myxococcus stipitatus]